MTSKAPRYYHQRHILELRKVEPNPDPDAAMLKRYRAAPSDGKPTSFLQRVLSSCTEINILIVEHVSGKEVQ